MKTTTYLALSFITAGILLSGCGSSSTESTNTPQTTPLTSGQFVDNYVQNIDYTCGDGTTGVTDINGSFHCTTLPVEFHIGGLQLGHLNTLPQDTQVFPQDLVGVIRADTNNSQVLAMAQFLQSCDEDNDTKNGIHIQAHIKEVFADKNITFDANDILAYAAEANITLISEDEAHTHLQETTTFVKHVEEHKNKNTTQQQSNSSAHIPQTITDALLTPANTLTQATKNTLAYMGNEERLAYDVYMELYNYHLDKGNGAIQQLTNIATKSEATHIATVQLLVEKYVQDLNEFTNVDVATNFTMTNAELNASQLPTGVYNIQAIQNLYDALIAKGQESTQAALEVGCMVEVTDITDLLEDIEIAKESNATDVVTAFEFLRDGSYSHYWAFDQGLKNMGVTDGCCSLGETYCHKEYPTNTQGADGSSSQNEQTQHNNNGNGYKGENKQSNGAHNGTGQKNTIQSNS